MECLIIGAGVFGLSIARALQRAGREVLVAEAAQVGAGASATPLGVLAPHAPDGWNAKKQSQFEALITLPGVIAELEAETGLATGYRRCGRLIPLTSERYRAIWDSRIEDARRNWQGRAAVEIVTPPDHWLSPDAAPHGAALCGLSARIDARAYVAALAVSVGKSAIRCGLTLERIEAGMAYFSSGEAIAAKHIILANGAEAFRFLPRHAGEGEKGQAAVLKISPRTIARLTMPRIGGGETPGILDVSEDAIEPLPLIYSDRLFMVPTGPDTVAVGSTSERGYSDPTATDYRLDALIEQAQTLCPALAGAQVIERWARLRPRSADRRLLIGPHPVHETVTVATGGFKTGLAMAHVAARNVVASLSGAAGSPRSPESAKNRV